MKKEEKLKLYGRARGRLITGRPVIFRDKTKYDRNRDKRKCKKEEEE